VPVGAGPHGVAVSPDGKSVFVTNHHEETVSVINTTTKTVTTTVPVGSYPWGVAFNPTGTKAYVTNRGSNTVSVIDTATKNVIDTIDVGSWPFEIEVTPDGTKVYVANADWNGVSAIDTISVIDTATNAVIATINVGNNPCGVAINPEGTKVYVVNLNSNSISVIDIATNTVITTVPVGSSPKEVSINPTGTKVYVTNEGSNTVSVIDTATNTITATVPVGTSPEGVSVTPDGKKVYVANMGSNTVSVIDTATNEVTDIVEVGNNPYAFGQFIGYISEPPLPVANFSSNVTMGRTPLSVQFTDLSENATSWKWDFGDGTNSADQNPVHTYSAAGNYTITLTVNNSAGSSTVAKNSYIMVAKPEDNVIGGYVPLSVKFTDRSENVTSWKWSFGDGSISSEQSPMHTYDKVGQYTVTLTVSNEAGSNAVTKYSYVSVINSLEAPVAAFSASTTLGKAPLNVSFNDMSTGSPTSWK